VSKAVIALFLEIRPLENWRKNFLEFLHVILELYIKYSKLGVLGLSSAKTGGKIKKVRLNKVHRRKRGSNWLSHLISFTPSFGFALPAVSLLLMFFIIPSLIRLSSCKILTQCLVSLKPYPVLLIFLLHENWGWNRGERVKLGPKDRVTSRTLRAKMCHILCYLGQY